MNLKQAQAAHEAASQAFRTAERAELERLTEAGMAQTEALRWADDAGADAYHAELAKRGA